MSDRAAVAVAAMALAGAFVGRGPAPILGVVVVVGALAAGRPLVLAVGVFCLAGALSAAADRGLAAPGRTGAIVEWVTVLTDPEPANGGMRADVRLTDGRHAQATARSAPSTAFESVRAGERIRVRGRLTAAPPGLTWLRVRHVAVVLTIDAIDGRDAGAPWMRAANSVRALLARGASVLPVKERSLFLGFVLGDRRDEPPDVADDFRGAGLTHLLAVSGQNVAFVLALAGPFLRRVTLWTRLPVTLAVIGFFALVTRFEPSVLRASAMAAVAVTASTLGRDASSIRLLALAVTALVLVDPFLVWSVGFQLSAAACIGIALLSGPLARVLPGPRVLREALAVTLGAQAGVAPVLVSTFGGVPVVSVAANLLAAPAAGPVMVWGLSAGLVAGLVGGPVAVVLHWPTRLLIDWIAWVAHRAALLPLGELGGRETVLVAASTIVAVLADRARLIGIRRAALSVAAAGALAPMLALRAVPPVQLQLGQGASLWRAGGTVLDLDGRVDTYALLQALRHAGVSSVDLVVARVDGPSTAAALDALERRFGAVEIVTPSSTRAPTARVVGRLRVEIRPVADRLTVEIALDGEGLAGRGARGPPV